MSRLLQLCKLDALYIEVVGENRLTGESPRNGNATCSLFKGIDGVAGEIPL